ncbi:hypothetical protein HAZT_HAZT012131 [Hyalella azteca]|uniref:Neurotransmitter-gated ion-channel ligand-binding domain-containing protein n=1 Tax=Hyalella azteca TaxID=294128 RepID=A0A6A0HCN3_HYAAZ|nr:hypothetical protein HAZT_HAZT012131 [Hyalella azteca]
MRAALEFGRDRPTLGLRWSVLMTLTFMVVLGAANPDAKRLYDDLLSSYNRLIRPVSNNNETITVWMRLRLSQLIDLVSGTFGVYFVVLLLLCANFCITVQCSSPGVVTDVND